MIIQQLEAELAEVHAQVSRQGLEYQALLNIKSKLEEEIATYHSLLEGTGPPYNGFTVPALPKNYDFKGMRPQDDVNVESISPPKDGNVIDNSASENANTEASGLAGNESVEFSLEQALCAAPRKLSPDSEQTLGKKNAEEEMITQKDLELNAANIAKNNQYIHEEAGQEMEEDPVILDEMEIKGDYDEMVSSVEEPVVKMNEEKGAVSLVVDTSLENTAVRKVEEKESPEGNMVVEKFGEASSLVQNTGVEMMEKESSPVENTQEEKEEREASPMENTQEKVVEEEAGPVENTQEKMLEEEASLVENTRGNVVEEEASPVEDTQVDKLEEAPSLVENTQVEKLEVAQGSVKDTQSEKAQGLVEDTQLELLETAPSPAENNQVETGTQLEEAAGPLENTQTKEEEEIKPAVENLNPEEEIKPAVENLNPEEEIKPAVENLNPEEELKQKDDEPENPEMEPFLNVK